jgi:hypothetical protein
MALHPKDYGSWYDKYLNMWPFMIDDTKVHTIGIAWIFKEDGKWNLWPRVTGNHQYYNAQFFLRLGFPLAVFFGMRLSSTRLLQLGLGWKQNGRFAIHLRFQTDESAAIGSTSPNYGQASGWDYGEH